MAFIAIHSFNYLMKLIKDYKTFRVNIGVFMYNFNSLPIIIVGTLDSLQKSARDKVKGEKCYISHLESFQRRK